MDMSHHNDPYGSQNLYTLTVIDVVGEEEANWQILGE